MSGRCCRRVNHRRSTTVGSDGKWSFTPTTPLTDGTHSITYTVKDAAGNESG
ncbi:Ig-like domain-containing protein, partial [Acinetobacter soli]